MKRKTIAICSAVIAVAALSTSACKRSNIQQTEQGQIVINTALDADVISKGLVDNSTALTRIQFLRKDESNASLTSVDFSGVTPIQGKRAAGASVDIEFDSKQIYETQNSLTSYFVAYHPAGSVASDVVTWTPDGTLDILISNLWNAGNRAAPLTSGMVLSHALARLEIILQVKSGFDLTIANTIWGSISKIEVEDTPTTLTLPYATAASTPGTTKGTVALLKGGQYTTGGIDGTIKANGNTEVQFASILVPTNSTELKVKVTTTKNGTNIVTPLTATLSETFSKGKVHTLTVTLGYNNEITIAESGIRAWDTNGNGGTGDLIDPDAVSVLVGNTRWATGNLIAATTTAVGVPKGTNGTKVKIGAPTDGGLYFQFGSLIGYKGGNNLSKGAGTGVPEFDGKCWGGAATYNWANEVMVYPSAFTSGPATWPFNRTDNATYFALQTDPYNKVGQKLSDFAGWAAGDLVSGSVAVGDPCRYYLGGSWRMPTAEDYGNLFNNVYENGTVGNWPNVAKIFPLNDHTAVNGKTSNAIAAGNGYGGSTVSTVVGRGIYANTTTTTRPASITDVSAGTLFFPASGYRAHNTGVLGATGDGAYTWCASVSSTSHGLCQDIHAHQLSPFHSNWRSHGFPVRCVSDFILTCDKPNNTAPVGASTYTINIMGAGVDSWTISEESDEQNAFSQNKTNGAGDGTFQVSVSKSDVTFVREATYKVTTASGIATIITLRQEGQTYILLDELVWAGGNLIANGANGAKIGSPYDIGLYFKFGSLIGWSGGDNGDGTGRGTGSPLAIRAKPSNYKGVTDFVNIPYYTVQAAELNVEHILPKTVDDAGGIGDPCFYHLGGGWRLPTAADYAKLFNQTYVPTESMFGQWDQIGGRWQETPIKGGFHRGLFFLGETGGRYDRFSGGIGNPNQSYTWTSAAVRPYKPRSLSYEPSSARILLDGTDRIHAIPVRCVCEVALTSNKTDNTVPYAATSIGVSIKSTLGEKWTVSEVSDLGNGFSPASTSGTGDAVFNINVAANIEGYDREAVYKVTLANGMSSTITLRQTGNEGIIINGVRWASGNLIANGANGAKIGHYTDGGLYFQFGSLIGWSGGANGDGVGMAPDNRAPTIQIKPAAYGNPAWSSTSGFYTLGTTGDLPTSDTPSSGVGDPCRYYLGKSWHTPTREEYKTIIPSQFGGINNPADKIYWSDAQKGAYVNATSASPMAGSLFFPGSGYLQSSDGNVSDKTVGKINYYWQSDFREAMKGNASIFNSAKMEVSAFYSNDRAQGQSVRCVSAPLIEVSGNNSAKFEGETLSVKVTRTDGENWTVTEVSDPDNGFAPIQTSGVGDRTFTVQVKRNPNTTARQVTYKITTASGLMSNIITLNQVAGSNSVLINGLYWAEGNLVAVNANANEAMVGSSLDAGLFFKFGSLLGWSGGGGDNGDGSGSGTPALSIKVRPAAYTNTHAWKDTPVYAGDNSSLTVPIPGTPSTGIGDPCRTYLGGKWRLPTPAEFSTLFKESPDGSFKGTGASWVTAPGAGTVLPRETSIVKFTNGLVFRVSGLRNSYDTGELIDLNSAFRYFSGTPSSSKIVYMLTAFANGISVNASGAYTKWFGMPVRCVSAP